jgi:hypothetical protein
MLQVHVTTFRSVLAITSLSTLHLKPYRDTSPTLLNLSVRAQNIYQVFVTSFPTSIRRLLRTALTLSFEQQLPVRRKYEQILFNVNYLSEHAISKLSLKSRISPTTMMTTSSRPFFLVASMVVIEPGNLFRKTTCPYETGGKSSKGLPFNSIPGVLVITYPTIKATASIEERTYYSLLKTLQTPFRFFNIT